MRLAVRRTIGVGGATAVAIGAALVLALPASAHIPKLTGGCDSDTAKTTVNVSLTEYSAKDGANNWVELTDTSNGKTTELLASAKNPSGKVMFAGQFMATKTLSGLVDHTITMTVFADDDVNPTNHGPGSADQWDGQFPQLQINACPKSTPTPPPPTTTTVPPTTTTTTMTVAPTTTSAPATTTAPMTTTSAPATTTTAAVAAATTTPGAGGGSLPFTGVNAALPLGIAGVLVLAGGGLLAWLKFGPRRRKA